MTRSVALVAAPRRRRGGISQAREQFEQSPVFRRARDYCERSGTEWYILSIPHVLLSPQHVTGSDEPALHTLDAGARQRWAEAVALRLRERCARSAEPISFVVYASQRYADLLSRAAPELAFAFPLSGLTLRERLRWYDERLTVRPRLLSPTSLPPAREP